MISLLVTLLLAQPTLGGGAQSVTVTNPTNPLKRVTTTTGAGKESLDVNCVSGCSGSSGGSGGGTLDGGNVTATQGLSNDGGYAWHVQVDATPTLFVADAGVLNVNFPVSQTVNGTVIALQGAGSDGGAWQVTATQGSPPWTISNSVVATANSDGASVTVGAASGTCLTSNSSRQGCSICLDPAAAQNIHVRFSASAATTSFQPLVPGQCVYCGTGNRVYTGTVTCISDSGNQAAYAVELN